ncbi:DUF2141 domain-containing protein [Anabaena subtropica]|uniref:DUF2141 domain-containing protein n=1 Tax=Anabaena subtropica FACHB-260 TaxID=2692884 RepID=A0ABR8CJH2_9NOST|nr:DUF2141 domain-containing protein [Anabaena subtropica]MBD2343300.1 DUF2141 domain-containing protein [Anabaena subtropica FACHB-260]
MSQKWTVSIILLAALGNLAWSLSARANFNGKLTVEIDGLNNNEGQVCVSIFASSQGFPNDRQRVLKRQCTQISEIPLKMTFDDLKAGSYAVAVIQDLNGDGTLNRNSLGMPVEPFGFSRNPDVRTSAPKFGDAAFVLAGPNTIIQIQMKKL